MTTYVITLTPEQALFDKIQQLKQEAYTLVGEQTYLQDEPHLTFFLGNFNDEETFTEKLKQTVASLPAPTFTITDWLTFPQDPVTHQDTLVCDIDQESAETLRTIQQAIITTILPFKEAQTPSRYQKQSFTGNYAQNLTTYGFPFVGKDWKPHFSIASFQHEAFLNVWETFKNKCPLGTYRGKEVRLYVLGENQELTLLATYPFKQ